MLKEDRGREKQKWKLKEILEGKNSKEAEYRLSKGGKLEAFRLNRKHYISQR